MLNKKAAELGVIGGLVAIAYSVITYFLGVAFMVSWTGFFLSIVVYLTLDITLTLRLKKLELERISYGQAFLSVIIYMGIGGLLTLIFGIVLTKIIDPDLPQKIFDASVVFTRSFMEWMGAKQEQIDKSIDKMKFDPNDYSYLKMTLQYLYRYVLYIIFALIMAIFIKRTPPLFDTRPLDQTPSN